MVPTNHRTAAHPAVILVTGGDSGIGLAIARKLGEEGYRIAICGVDRRQGARALATLEKANIGAVSLAADVRKEYSDANLIRRAVSRFCEEAQGWKGVRLYDLVQRALKEPSRFFGNQRIPTRRKIYA